ncbi:hypothetical protein OGAPHI_006032 [Ogataea philodendri]|uniref:Exocyst complex component SEC5 n=1 Tax=Ogataea philodendri TaxID=1378263 RepID=A0A9P8NX28_9ASCO|nr:uncharacterized protein OGAPHI_006032 [Ogataea philodendri]KAH3661853.1 hypothetical protein OGAPHI_006032 [Ogataea philodendri]
MNTQRLRLVDDSTLLDFYQLRTLDPEDYAGASTGSNPIVQDEDIDLDEIARKIPKEQLNKFLTDQPDEPVAQSRRSALNVGDPLGFHESVLDELIDKDVIDDSRDPKKTKYLVDSKAFNARLFLTTIHKDKTYKELVQSVSYLEKSLQVQKPQLQKLIGENFQKAIDNKKLLDEIYSEYSMSNLSENVSNLSESIAKANVSSTMMLNPVLDGLDRANEIENFLSLLTNNSVLLDLPKKFTELVSIGDFDSILTEYNSGKKVYQASLRNNPSNRPVLDRIWLEVEDILSGYKKQLWEKLGNVHIENVELSSAQTDQSFLPTIKKLLELGVDENPIPYFLNLEYNYIKDTIDGDLTKVQLSRFLKARENLSKTYSSEDSSKISMSTLRRTHLSLADHASEDEIYDLPLVADLWGFLCAYVNELTEEIISDRFYKFTSMLDFFVHSDLEEELAIKNPESRKFLRFESYEIKRFNEYVKTLSEKLCYQLRFIFDATSAQLSMAGSKINFDQNLHKNLFDLDSFGFIPPHSSVLTTLTNCINLQRDLEKNIAKLSKKTSVEYDLFLSTMQRINTNFVDGVLCVLINDSKRLKYIEDWEPSTVNKGCTKTADYLWNFYQLLIPKLHTLIKPSDEESFEAVKKQFIASFDIIVDNQAESLKTSAQNEELRDLYYPATLSNLSLFKLRLLPRILKLFDTKFGTSFSTSSLDVYGKIEKYESDIYAEYISQYKTQLEETILQGIKSVDWFQFSAKQILVSGFVLKPINLITIVMSKLLSHKSNINYIMKIELDLINHFIFKLIESLKHIQQFNSSGLLQISVDLRFLVEVFQHFNQSGLKEQINLDRLITVSDRFSNKNTKYANEINDIVRSNLQSNKAQMDCFYRL